MKEIAGTDGDAQSQNPFTGFSRIVLMNGKAGVDAAASQKIGTHRSAGAFRGRQNHIHKIRWDDAGLITVNDAESMRKIEGISWIQAGFDLRPCGHLTGVGQEKLNNRRFFGGGFQGKQGFSGNKTVGNGPFPGIGAFPLADDDMKPVVFHVQGLPRSLNPISQNGNDLVFQDFFCMTQRKLRIGNHFFHHTAKIDLCHLIYISLITVIIN